MSISRILVPTDFTRTADRATIQAVHVARAAGAAIDLLHIANDQTPGRLVEAGFAKDGLEQAMTDKAGSVRMEFGVECGFLVRSGSILQAIPEAANEGNHQLLVAGTHGVQGIRQNLFGADMLRIVKQLAIPSIILPQSAQPKAKLAKVLMPVGSHDSYKNLVQAVGILAKAFGAEVCIYNIERPNLPMSDKMSANVREAIAHLRDAEVHCKLVSEQPTVFSIGFAKQTLQHAADQSIDLLAIMGVSSEEHAFLADPDKERIINNEHGIPVLCGPGIEAWTTLMAGV